MELSSDLVMLIGTPVIDASSGIPCPGRNSRNFLLAMEGTKWPVNVTTAITEAIFMADTM